MSKLKKLLLTSAVLLVLCGAVIVKLAANQNDLNKQNQVMQNYRIQLENVYEKSFFELADSIKNMQYALSKVHASNGRENQQTLLTQIVSQAETIESDIGCLPIDNQCLQKTAEFANKTSDFCLYLQTKLANGHVLDKNDRKVLKELSHTSQVLAGRLSEMSDGIGGKIMLTDGVLHEGKIEGINSSFEDINKNTFNYPEMIYDGPFSDAKKEVADINLPFVSKKQVQEKIEKTLSKQGVKEVVYTGEAKNRIDVYNFEVKTDKNQWFVQASQKGGMICFVSCACSETEGGQKSSAMQMAKDFANLLGYEVEPIWVSKDEGGPTYVNLAPVINGIVIYPDIVKVAVDDNGICGFEGFNYIANHKDRKFDKMYRDETLAREKLSEGIEIKNSNLALIPKNQQEILCFEFECMMDDEQYFVYINVDTLKEEDIFKVVEGTEGYTVI